MKPAPCLNCLVIPICRQRYFLDMKNTCKLVEAYLFKKPAMAVGRNDFDIRVNRVHEAINPVQWKKRENIDITPFTQQFATGQTDTSVVVFALEVL